jgi:predicted metal-dependent hydrolase
MTFKRMIIDPRFKKGLELFNEGEYFECHEVIEGLWLETPPEDPYRDLYKGVIQAAAAIYQFDRGILSGAVALFKTSVNYLENYKPNALGLDVERLVEDMKACFGPLEDWDRKKKISLQKKLLPQLHFMLK